MFISIILTALIAGIVQGTTGFGAGIIMMFVLPVYYSISQSAGISAAVLISMTGMIAYSYRKHIHLRKLLVPAVMYLAASSTAIYFAQYVDQALMKKLLGAFLMILSCYYLFFNKSSTKKELGLPVSCLFIVISGICDGLFGIGGPLMVLYYLSVTDSTQEYLGTLQLFFFTANVYNTLFRITNGILTSAHLVTILSGVAGVMTGAYISTKLIKLLDENKIRKLIYMMIGIAGIINVIN